MTRKRRNVTMAALAVVGLASIEVAGAASTTYSYDALGRLVRVDATTAQTSMRQSYQYDAAGNRVGARRSTSGPTGIIPVRTSLNSVGGSVTLSVSVGGSMAGGMIDFYFNDVLVGTAPVINGSAEIVFQGMALGNYTVRAVYAGDGHYDSATSQFNVRVQDLSWLPAVLDLLSDSNVSVGHTTPSL